MFRYLYAQAFEAELLKDLPDDPLNQLRPTKELAVQEKHMPHGIESRHYLGQEKDTTELSGVPHLVGETIGRRERVGDRHHAFLGALQRQRKEIRHLRHGMQDELVPVWIPCERLIWNCNEQFGPRTRNGASHGLPDIPKRPS